MHIQISVLDLYFLDLKDSLWLASRAEICMTLIVIINCISISAFVA